MIKYTPGPWISQDEVSGSHTNKPYGEIQIMPAGRPDNRYFRVGSVFPYGGEGFPDYETAKGNANLIAAAPEMYELLFDIFNNEGMMPDTMGKINQLLSSINQPAKILQES